MPNKQIDIRKVKRIYKLYSAGVSKRQISKLRGLSSYEVSEMTLKELHKLFKSKRKPKSQQLKTVA